METEGRLGTQYLYLESSRNNKTQPKIWTHGTARIVLRQILGNREAAEGLPVKAANVKSKTEM